MRDEVRLSLSSERFRVVYHLRGNEADATQTAKAICVEQTVEFPADLLPPGDIPDHVVGRVESLEPAQPHGFAATISYAIETAGAELTQLLNVAFGNISLLPGIRLERLELPGSLLGDYRGPRFGRAGLRDLVGAPRRPLVCTALKPMGLSPQRLAAMAGQLARGGVDIIKDDHGLADQPFCRFDDRVQRCADAIASANAETGGRTLYAPSSTAPSHLLMKRARFAKHVGASALLVSPGLTGLDAMRALADDDALGLPILCHPALLGAFTASGHHGISHFALYGQILRLAGADACIFPNHGGRFSFSRDDCRSLAQGTGAPLAHLRPIFPVPAGGMSLEHIPDMRDFYGDEVIFLIGGDLHRRGPDLTATCRRFVDLVSAEH